ncbi:hypothetical protein Nmel_009442 [Mimus melanotis]
MGLYLQLQDMFSDTAVTPEDGGVCKSTTALDKKKEFVYSHPKLKKLEEIVVEHFKSWKQRCSAGEDSSESGSSAGDTRVMIFSSFRDSVQEIAEMLARLRPAVRAMTFVGHSSGKATKGFTQKEQLEVVRRFREGGYNTLVSTCVGEEGLDIGEVDLIVCFDAQRSPVRLVQRMGRTGRRRHGRIGDCSYEQELQPHLRMEDVNIPGNKKHLSTSNPLWKQRARKDLAKTKPKPFPPDPGDDGSEFFSTFKITKPRAPRRAPGLPEEEPGHPSASPPGPRLAVPAHSDSDKDEGLAVTFDLNAFIDLCDNGDSPASPASPAGESRSRTHGDSGYETSPVASELFYLPESCRDSLALLAPPQEPPGLEEAFSRVQRLLSQPPPSGDELQGLGITMREEGPRSPSPKVLPDGPSEALQDSASPKTDPSLEKPDVPAPRGFSRSPCLFRAVSPAAAGEEEQLWSDSFDGLLDSEEFPEVPNVAPSMGHPLIKDTGEAGPEVPAGEQSLRLFEDEAGEDMGGDSPVGTGPAAGTEGEPGRGLCVSPRQRCREQPWGRGTADPHGCSQDLFSVTFDLGFSIEDSSDIEYIEDESSEHARNAESPKLNSAPGAEPTEGAKISLGDDSRLETSPGWDFRRLKRRDTSSPLSLQSRNGREGTQGAPAAPALNSGGSRTGREPPEPLPSAPLTPTSRKGVNIKAAKRIPMKISNAREQIPKVPPVDEVQDSPWRQNFGTSAMGCPSGRTESLEDTKARGSPAAVPGTPSPSLCILADSREISSGLEVISSLRAVHGLRVQICPLGSSDYIVSNRLAVDRLLQSELQSPGNRNRLSQRLQRLQGIFDRICVIVETDRVRPGETSRFFQRTQYYDGVLSALVQAGIKILFSSCQEESAALLKELAVLEHRKDAAIQVPTEPEGHGRDILSFYLSVPNLSYGAALNLCHSFGSIAAVANSSVPALAAGARLSRSQAEELQRFLRHDFDLQLLPQPLPAKGKS